MKENLPRMNSLKPKNLILIVSVLFSTLSWAQEHKHFRVGAGLLHTYVKAETQNGNDYIALPSFGLDLEYWLNDKIGFGLHNDLELEVIEIQDDKGLAVERSFPIFVTFDVLWKPINELVLVIGPGMEFAKEENLVVIRTGLEYEIPIQKGWAIAPMVFYDTRLESFGSWNYGVSFGKSF
jgi:hypothetical protein